MHKNISNHFNISNVLKLNTYHMYLTFLNLNFVKTYGIYLHILNEGHNQEDFQTIL